LRKRSGAGSGEPIHRVAAGLIAEARHREGLANGWSAAAVYLRASTLDIERATTRRIPGVELVDGKRLAVGSRRAIGDVDCASCFNDARYQCIDGALFVLGTGKGASVPAAEIERTVLPFLGVKANGAECSEVQIPEVYCVVKVAIS
jgi:hypothetical protein